MFTSHKIETGMSLDQLRAVAPTVFAEGAHMSRSERYTYIPTGAVVERLMQEGFTPVSVQQTRSKDVTRRAFAKHLIQFRRLDAEVVAELGDAAPSLALLNSHDGTSSYRLLSGIIRYACLNSVLNADIDSEVCVYHSGNVVEKVIEGSYRIIENSTRAIESARTWSRIELNQDERLAFATAAAQLRFDPETQSVDPRKLIEVKRDADTGNDLWTTFNRAQEGLVRGDFSYRVGAQRRKMFAKPIKGIDQNIGINKALWTLASKMAELKGAAQAA